MILLNFKGVNIDMYYCCLNVDIRPILECDL